MKGNLRRLLAIFLVLMLLSADICAIAEAAATLTLPKELQIIEEEAFAGNTSIEKVIVPDGTTEIRSRAFADSSMTELILPDSLTFIAEDAFEGCGEFALTVPENCYAYDRCVELGLINGPLKIISMANSLNGVPNIGDTLQWSVSASGGLGSIEYRFELYRDDVLVETQDYTFGNFYSKKFEEAGIYRLDARCRDAAGNVSPTESNTITIGEKTVEITEIILPKGVLITGDTLSWDVATENGAAPLQYRYELLLEGEAIAVQEYSSHNSYTCTADVPGTYALRVECMEANGRTASMTSGTVTVYAPEEASPAAPFLLFDGLSFSFAADMDAMPVYEPQSFDLVWNPVEYANKYSVVLQKNTADEWADVLTDDSVVENGYSLGAALFANVTERTEFKVTVSSQGLRTGGSSEYYFAVAPGIVDESITINGVSDAVWSQNSKYASTRAFEVHSDLEWRVESVVSEMDYIPNYDKEWLEYEIQGDRLIVHMPESDEENERYATITLSNGVNTATIKLTQNYASAAPRMKAPAEFSTNAEAPSEYPAGGFLFEWDAGDNSSVRLSVYERMGDGTLRQLYRKVNNNEYLYMNSAYLTEELKVGSVYVIELAGVWGSSYAANEVEEDLLKTVYYVKMSDTGHFIHVNGSEALSCRNTLKTTCYISASNYFTYSVDADWLRVSSYSNKKQYDAVSVVAELNNTGIQREGHVYFQCGNATATVTVVQDDMSMKILHPSGISQTENSPTKLYMDMNLLDTNYFYFVYQGEDLYLEKYVDGAYGDKVRISNKSDYGVYSAEIETSDVSSASHCRLTVEYDDYSAVFYVDFCNSDEENYYDSFWTVYEIREEGAHQHSFNVYPEADTKWKLSSNVSWLTPASSSGPAGDTPISVRIAANTTGQPRVGRLTFTSTTTSSVRMVDVKQSGENVFGVYYENDSTYDFEPFDPKVHCTEVWRGSSVNTSPFKVYATEDIDVTSNVNWITPSLSRPDSGEEFKLELEENPVSNGVRTGTVTISDGISSVVVTVKQAPDMTDVTLSSPALSTDYKNPSVVSYEDMTVVWNSVTNAVSYRVTLDNNLGYYEIAELPHTGVSRYSCIVPKDLMEAFADNYIKITAYDQYGYTSADFFYFMPTPGDAVLINGSTEPAWTNASDVSTAEDFVIQSSGDWTAAADQAWITLSAASGVSGDVLKVTLAENTGSMSRMGQVAVSVNGAVTNLSIVQCAYLAEEYPSMTSPVFSSDKASPTLIEPCDNLTFTWKNEPQASYYELTLYQQKSQNTRMVIEESEQLDHGESSYTFSGLELEAGQLYSVTLSRQSDRYRHTARSYYFMLTDESAWVLLNGEAGCAMEEDGSENAQSFTVTASGYWSAQTSDDWLMVYKESIGQDELDAKGYESSKYAKYSAASGERLYVSMLANPDGEPRTGKVTVSCGSASAVITVYQYQNYSLAEMTSPTLATSSSNKTSLPFGALTFRWNAASGGTGRYSFGLDYKDPEWGWEEIVDVEGLTARSYSVPAGELYEGCEYRLWLGTEVVDGDYYGRWYYFELQYEEVLKPELFVDWSNAYAGGWVDMYGGASGGAGDYRFAYELFCDGEQTAMTDLSAGDYHQFPIVREGRYQVRLYAVDASGAKEIAVSDEHIVSEEAVRSYINLSQTSYAAGAEGGEMNVIVDAGSEWSASVSGDWISVVNDSEVARISVAANTSADQRTGTVVFSADGCTAEFAVTQLGMEADEEAVLSISQNVWNLLNPSAAMLNLTIETTGSWSVFDYPQWVTVSSASGTGKATISVYAAFNNGITRSGTVSVEVDGIVRQLFITQVGNDIVARVMKVTASDTAPMIGDKVTFAIETKNADELMFMVDGVCYDTISVYDTTTYYTWSFSSDNGGVPRSVRFVPKRKGVQGLISDEVVIDVWGKGSLKASVLKPVPKAVLGAGLEVEWSAVENAERYTLYIYRNGSEVYRKNDLTELNHYVEPKYLTKPGAHTVLLMASGSGYTQSQVAMIVNIEIPEATFSITYPTDGSHYVAKDVPDFIVDNPDGYHIAIRITDAEGNTTYLPENNRTCSDTTIKGKLLFYPEATGSYTAQVMAWPTEIRTTDGEAWYDSGDAIGFVVDGPIAKSFIVAGGNANNLLTTDCTSLTLKTNNAVSKVEYYLDGYPLTVYKNGVAMTAQTEYDSASNSVYTFKCDINPPAEGVRKYTARAYADDGTYSERSYTFYAVTPAAAATKYPSERGVHLKSTPYASETSGTLLNLSDVLTVRGTFGNLAYVSCGSKRGYVPKNKLSDTQVHDWDALTLNMAYRSSDYAGYVGSGDMVAFRWNCNEALPEGAEFRVYKKLSTASAWTYVGATQNTQLEVSTDSMGVGVWSVMVTVHTSEGVKASSTSSKVFRIYENATEYMEYVLSSGSTYTDVAFYKKGIALDAELLCNAHYSFTVGWTTYTGVYVPPIDIDKLADNAVVNTYSVLLGDGVSAIDANDTMSRMYLLDGIMKDLYAPDGKVPSLDTLFVPVSFVKDCLGILGKDIAEALDDAIKGIDTDEISIEWLKKMLTKVDLDQFACLSVWRERLDKGATIATYADILSDTIANAYVYCSVPDDKLEEAATQLKNSYGTLRGIGDTLEKMKDNSFAISYALLSGGVALGQELVNSGRDGVIDALAANPTYGVIFASAKGALWINNVLLNVDDITTKAYQLEWNVEAAEEYLPTYKAALDNFLENPLNQTNYEEFVAKSEMFARLVDMEWNALAAFADAIDGAWMKSLFMGFKAHDKLEQMAEDAEMIVVNIQTLTIEDLDDLYNNCLKRFGVEYVAWDDKVM